MHRLRLATICDLLEEGWPSMDLVAEMLVGTLEGQHAESTHVTKICPPLKERAGHWSLDFGPGSKKRLNADRFLNRFWDYPRYVRRLRNDFDLFHIVDHSYSQLVHALPPERTIVTCHDLDTFKCLLEPEQEPRSIFFKAMMKKTLSGFRKAAFVTCDSDATRDQILEYKLISPERLAIVRLGVHPSCEPEANAEADDQAARMIEESGGVGERRTEVRGQRSEVRDPWSVGGGRWATARSRESGARSQESGEQRTEVGGQWSEVSDPWSVGGKTARSGEAGARRQEAGEHRTEVRGRRSEVRDPWSVVGKTARSGEAGGRRQETGVFSALPLAFCPLLLHVGSTIPRKRIDLLLKIFAEVKKRFPQARLLRVGGPFTNDQEELARELKVRDSIIVLPHLDRDVLAAVYRRAALVLLPSEREGFGLPVVESMACGTPVVASDLSVLREVGGQAATYCGVADVDAWANALTELLRERTERPDAWRERKAKSISQAARFSWSEYARSMVEIYRRALSVAQTSRESGKARVGTDARVPLSW